MDKWRKGVDTSFGPEWFRDDTRASYDAKALELDSDDAGGRTVSVSGYHIHLDDMRAFLAECDAWIAEQEKAK